MLGLVDLFCGGGGTSLGFKQAGYDIAYGIDAKRSVVETYEYNIGSRCYLQEIGGGSVLPESVPVGSYVCSLSPPCVARSRRTSHLRDRDWSHIHKLGMDALRMFEYARQPSAYFLECVPDYRHSPEYREIVDYLRGLGYSVLDRVVNAANFGVPQTRRRLIMLAFAEDYAVPEIMFEMPEPRHRWVTVREALDGMVLDPNPQRQNITPYRRQKIIEANAPGRDKNYKKNTHHLLDENKPAPTVMAQYTNVSTGNMVRRVFSNDGRKNMLMDIDKPSNTILTGYTETSRGQFVKRLPGGAMEVMDIDKPAEVLVGRYTDVSRGRYVKHDEDIGLSVGEGQILQGFPADFRVFGKCTPASMIIGNAVPPPVARYYAEFIASVLGS